MSPAAAAPDGPAASTSPTRRRASTPHGPGYRFVAADGGIFSFGDAQFFGSAGATKLNKPIVGMAARRPAAATGWSRSDGGIFSFGDATFFGSTGAIHLNQPIVGMAATPTGKGYWFVAADGGIFAFGDAKFFGSTGGSTLNQPIVGMAVDRRPATATGWSPPTAGSSPSATPRSSARPAPSSSNKPIVGMAAPPTGNGYWLVAADGGIFAFGDATFFGSTGGMHAEQADRRHGRDPDRRGLLAGGLRRRHLLLRRRAGFHGSTGDIKLNQPIVGMAS